MTEILDGRGTGSHTNEQQRAELRELVVKGPDPATDKVVRWRCVDLRIVVALLAAARTRA
jgi:hypothetical protein